MLFIVRTAIRVPSGDQATFPAQAGRVVDGCGGGGPKGIEQSDQRPCPAARERRTIES
jgi:hypothetical protein